MGNRYFFRSFTFFHGGLSQFNNMICESKGKFPNQEDMVDSIRDHVRINNKVVINDVTILSMFEFKDKADYDSFRKKEIEPFKFVDENCDSKDDQNELNRLTEFFNESEQDTKIDQEDLTYNDEYSINILNYDYKINYEGTKFSLSFAEKTNKEHFVEDFIDGYKSVMSEVALSINPIGGKTVSAKYKPVVTDEGDYFLLNWEIG